MVVSRNGPPNAAGQQNVFQGASENPRYAELGRLPLHALKIDVSFVRNMLRNAQDRVIVESTVGLAHSLGLEVVAEGIEDEATLAALRAMGCDEGQGFVIAPPMDAVDAARWMSEASLARH